MRHFFLILVLVMGCDKKEQPPVDQPVAPPAAKQADPEAVAPAQLIDEERVNALIKSWTDAQNGSNFEQYSGLYAERFSGIKRAGPKTSSFDREGWLKDRKRMFERKMDVSVKDIEISSTSHSAIAKFEQTWASGTFKDVGPKQLVIIKENDELKIAREEMLASAVVGVDSTVTPYDPSKLAFLIGDTYVVLQLNDDQVKVGPADQVDVYGEAIANVLEPTPELKAFIGQEVAVHRDDEERCISKIESLHVIARVTPHFGQVSYWQGREPDEIAPNQNEIAKEIWRLADGARVVVGKLSSPCEGVFAAVPVPDYEGGLLSLDVPEAWKKEALNLLRNQKGYKTVQSEFENFSGNKGAWDEAGKVHIHGFGGHSGEVEYIVVSAEAGAGCGDFRGEFWGIFNFVGKTRTLLTDPVNPGEFFIPNGAAMIDRQAVFTSSNVMVQKVGTVWRRTHEARIPYFDCPC